MAADVDRADEVLTTGVRGINHRGRRQWHALTHRCVTPARGVTTPLGVTTFEPQIGCIIECAG